MKRIISLVMVIVLIASIVSILAIGLTENGFTYTVEDGEATVTGYTNNAANISIPETLGGVPVAKIGDFAFANRAERNGSDISSLTLPSTLREIGEGAFAVNSTASSLIIPENVEYIGARAFHCWIKLTNVVFRGNALKTIGQWAFRNCHLLGSVTLPSSLKTIEPGAFSYCAALSSIIIPASVEDIGYEAFLACTALSSATIKNKNAAIGDNCFDLTAESRSLKISGYANSSAQRFASAESFTFITLDDPGSPDDPISPDEPSSGEYFVQITYTITGANNLKENYAGFNKENNDSGGISLLYKGINGTAENYREMKWDLGPQMTSKTTGTFTLSCSVSGFPYMLYGYLDDNAAGGSAAFNINKLEVGSSVGNLKTVWQGKISLASQFHAFGVSLDWENNDKADYFYTPDGNNKVQSSSGAWEKPYAKTIEASFEHDKLALSAQEDSVSNAFTYSATDQYGVSMAKSLCSEAKVMDTAAANSVVQYKNGSGTVTCNKQIHLLEKGKNEQDVALQFKWSGKDSTRTGTAKFTVEDEKYTISWLDEAGNSLNTTNVYYGETPAYAIPVKEPTAQQHFVPLNWSPALTAVEGDAQYQATYQTGEHDFVYSEADSTPATCNQAGREVYVCSVCEYTKTVDIPQSDHAFALSDQKAATCTEAGYKEYSCSNCNETYREDIEALGHNYVEEVVQPTCTVPGSLTRTCTRCQDEQTTVLEATGHSYKKQTVLPTCTAQGYTTYTCSNCTDSYEGDFTQALGHNWDKGVESTAADCTHAGEKRFTCQRCQSEKTQTIEALGHNWSDWAALTAPTCEEGGTLARSCARCQIEEEKHADALGHDMVLKTKNPESGVEGVMYYECARGCGKFANCVMDAQGEKGPGEVYEAQQQATASSLDIPTATFNTYNCSEYRYNYVNRGASLRIDEKAAQDVQAIRFAASMLIPKDAEIVDFGFIYTREDCFKSMKKFVLGGANVYSTSVINGKYTKHQTAQGEVRTFNVVLNLNKENWSYGYMVRSYIIYQFAGETFTVYDGMFSNRSVDYIARQIMQSPTERQSVKDYVQEKIINR
ncbi:MAG: leucine-rich repeat domain-containing protein [Clostridia bacterium]|nr:leucine-rich repeat domain-containing protein [Clostridia bacterium]